MWMDELGLNLPVSYTRDKKKNINARFWNVESDSQESVPQIPFKMFLGDFSFYLFSSL